MEQKKGALILVLFCLIFGAMVRHSTASFKKCYRKCFIKCIIGPPLSPIFCPGKCLKDCIFLKKLDFQTDSNRLCKMDCVTSLCTKISSKEHPSKSLILLLLLFLFMCLSYLNSLLLFSLDEEKVEACVDSCPTSCSKNYFLISGN